MRFSSTKISKFEKSAPKVVALFDEISEGAPGERRTMFGYPCLFTQGNMHEGTYANRLFFRVGLGSVEGWMAKRPVLKLFEPVKGRAMKEYLEVESDENNKLVMMEPMNVARAYARSLKPKAAKGK